MEIKVLGPGCARCHKLEVIIREVVREMAIDARVEYIADMKKIMEYRVLSTPGLVIDGKLVCSGKAPSRAELTTLIANVLTDQEPFKD